MTINHSREVGDQVGDLRVLSVSAARMGEELDGEEGQPPLLYAKLGPLGFLV